MENDCTHFERLALIEPLLRALRDEGYTEPTPVQQTAIPEVLAGRDVMATAKTGTGKTAAFALPILQLLHESDGGDGVLRCLILTPTRELALQIEENFKAYGRHLGVRTAVVVGGVSAGPQIQALRRRPDVLVATPGRLLDLLGQGHVRLRDVEVAVLDEADRMLDMGFLPDVRRIVGALPRHRQTLLFSATLSTEIARLAESMLQRPVRVEVTPPATVADNITQKVLLVEHGDKRALLTSLFDDPEVRRALVFTRTKHRANRVARQLSQAGISADAIHSNKSQGARQRALDLFDRGKVRVLVATDIVSRGIDVDDITHVINYEIPNEPEAYVHRIGRTARAGSAGVAISLCNAEELPLLAGIEKLTRIPLVETEHAFHSAAVAARRQSSGSDRRPAQRSAKGAQGKPAAGGKGGPRRRKRQGNGRPAGDRQRNVETRADARLEPAATATAQEPRFGRRHRAA